MKIAINRDIYDRCQLFMSSIGYEGITYESVLDNKILTAHYYLVGCIAMARFIDDEYEAEDLIRSFYQSIDEETLYSLLPLFFLLGHLFNINIKDVFEHIAEKGGRQC